MNIKRAKQEIENTIKAYLQKDAYGDYVIPTIRQRPILLMGLEKPRSWSRLQENVT